MSSPAVIMGSSIICWPIYRSRSRLRPFLTLVSQMQVKDTLKDTFSFLDFLSYFGNGLALYGFLPSCSNGLVHEALSAQMQVKVTLNPFLTLVFQMQFKVKLKDTFPFFWSLPYSVNGLAYNKVILFPPSTDGRTHHYSGSPTNNQLAENCYY